MALGRGSRLARLTSSTAPSQMWAPCWRLDGHHHGIGLAQHDRAQEVAAELERAQFLSMGARPCPAATWRRGSSPIHRPWALPRRAWRGLRFLLQGDWTQKTSLQIKAATFAAKSRLIAIFRSPVVGRVRSGLTRVDAQSLPVGRPAHFTLPSLPLIKQGFEACCVFFLLSDWS